MSMETSNRLNLANLPPDGAGYSPRMVTRQQIRAARQLLLWSQTDLATAANLPLAVIKNLERGALDPRQSQLVAIEEAFDRAGVIFLEVGDIRSGGRGVRLR
jgi:predicted transcriptional regulator